MYVCLFLKKIHSSYFFYDDIITVSDICVMAVSRLCGEMEPLPGVIVSHVLRDRFPIAKKEKGEV